ncbi:MAG: right-handed parallel beta-helix repeat-containing protein [Solirubrobacterales bacterium]|nr:right-handed parallel beta-helix repeat-containing protein [Solirubrobacterales bacterium]MCB8970314.1 right-handed parallel beta-helix repeat-containing protein [Thermoleophilales bacterium]
MEIAASCRKPLFIAIALVAVAFAVLSAQASAQASCDLVAAQNGSDSAPGTAEQPLRSVQALASSLRQGQTGCLRTGTYTDPSDEEVNLAVPNVTLTSYPGERATIRTRLWVEQGADGVTIADLDLDGRNPTNLPSPTINADDVVLRGNDITNQHTAICVSLGSPDTWGRAHRTLVEGNRIHDCGRLPATNQDHGIYVNSSDDAIIRNNLIYDNTDRGIQLYPDAQGTLVTGNVIDGNGQGVIFGGHETTASSNNIVEHNVITNSKIRDNVESSWGGDPGTGNVARDNCVGGGAYDEGDGGILQSYPGGLGFKAVDNLIHVPKYANADGGDFTIPSDDPCAEIIAGVAAETAAPEEVGSGSSAAVETVTIRANRRSVRRLRPVRITGRAKGADSVTVRVRRSSGWRKLGTAHIASNGAYRMRVRIADPGRRALKAEAKGVGDSAPLRLRVRKS